MLHSTCLAGQREHPCSWCCKSVSLVQVIERLGQARNSPGDVSVFDHKTQSLTWICSPIHLTSVHAPHVHTQHVLNRTSHTLPISANLCINIYPKLDPRSCSAASRSPTFLDKTTNQLRCKFCFGKFTRLSLPFHHTVPHLYLHALTPGQWLPTLYPCPQPPCL